MAEDLSFLPDQREDMSFLPDKQEDLSFLPDRGGGSSGVSGVWKPVEGLFGTRLGEGTKWMGEARWASEKSREGLKMLTDKIPEVGIDVPTREPARVLSKLHKFLPTPPGSRGVVSRLAEAVPETVRPEPKIAAEVVADFSASMIEPEMLALGIIGKGVTAAVRSPLIQKLGQTISEKSPLWLKKVFQYRAGQPEAYKEVAEKRLMNIGKGTEKAKELGEELSKGLSKEEQLRLGGMLRGEVAPAVKEVKLADLAKKTRSEFVRLGKEAVDEGLLNEETFLKNMKTYMPRLYRKHEGAIVGGRSVKEIFGEQPRKIIGKRFLKREAIPESIRTEMGEVKEAAYPAAKGIAQLTHDVETARLFRKVAENPEWVSNTAKEGFVEMTRSAKKVGGLSGKYIHPEIAADINEITRGPGRIEKLVTAWKFGKVIPNIATHFRNMFSNSILFDLSGVDFHKQPRLLWKALKELSSKGKYFKEAKEGNLLGYEFVGAEIKGLMEVFEKQPQNIWEGIKAATTKTAKFAGDTYQKEEQLFKLAKFISERERGAGITQAVKEAEKWLFNYQKVSPFVDKARRSAIGIPFLTFTSKALPRVAETAAMNPMRLYKYKLMGDSIENVAQETLGLSDDDVSAIKRNARGTIMILPWRDEQGNVQTLDLSYILPWGDISETGGVFGLPPAISPGSITRPIAEVGMNYSPFRKKEIYLKTDTIPTQIKKSVDYLYKAFMPSFAPQIPGISEGGYSTHKLQAGIEGKADYFGRVRSVSTVLADVFLGLKAYPVDPELSKSFEKWGIKKDLDEIKKEYRGKILDKGATDDDKFEAKEVFRTKLERIVLEKSETE